MEFQRVTEILYPFSGLKHVKPDVLQNAAVRGTKVHSYCESIAKGLGVWEVGPEYQGYIDSFLSWWNQGIEVLAIEKRFWDRNLMITGQVDFITKTEKGACIVDLKTSAHESKSWLLQGSAYSYMAKQNGYDIKDIQFVKLLKDGRPAKVFTYEENMDLFNQCLNVYRYFYGTKSKSATRRSK